MDSLLESLRRGLPLDVALAAASGHAALVGDEAELTRNWAPARRDEFAVGRASARRALAMHGQGTVAISSDLDGLPNWPPGFIGSISHKAGVSISAVARLPFWVGVDLELVQPRDEELLAEGVCTASEQQRLKAFEAFTPSPVTLLFSAKEAVYKAQFPATHIDLDWRDIEIDLRPASFSVTCKLLDSLWNFRAGRFAQDGAWLATIAVALPSNMHV